MAINSEKNRGFALLIAVIFMSAMLTIGLALGSLAYKQQILASTAIDSQYAFYAADSALECALHEDQQNNLFAWRTPEPTSAPVMACENLAPVSTPTKVWDSEHWVVTSRFAIESGKYCADVTVDKPKDAGTTYIFSEGYNVPCATVENSGGKRFLSRGIKSTYTSAPVISEPGIEWVSRDSANDLSQWSSVTYGRRMFVAVARSGSTRRVMYSTNGVNWTSNNVGGVPGNSWESVAFGNGKFVAVGSNGAVRAMHSSDGKRWTAVSVPQNAWQSVAYGNGVFVAVACGVSGTGCNATEGNRVMWSDDGGVSWNEAESMPATNQRWKSVAFGDGTFVAVSTTGTLNHVMTSIDGGRNWTTRASATNNTWSSVTYNDGLFVAVGRAAGNQVMYSTDAGTTWSNAGVNGVISRAWTSVTFGDSMFVAVANSGSASGNRVMTSVDGKTWIPRMSTSDNAWNSVTFGDGMFAAVATSGAGDRVMTSGSK